MRKRWGWARFNVNVNARSSRLDKASKPHSDCEIWAWLEKREFNGSHKRLKRETWGAFKRSKLAGCYWKFTKGRILLKNIKSRRRAIHRDFRPSSYAEPSMRNLQIIIQAVPGSRSDCQVNTNEIVSFFVFSLFFFEGADLQEKERVFIHRDITVIRWHLRSTSRYWTNRQENKITYLYAYAMALLTAPNGFSELVH